MTTGPAVWKIFWLPSSTASPELGELGAAVIDDGHVHGAENAVGDRARPWNLQKMPSLSA